MSSRLILFRSFYMIIFFYCQTWFSYFVFIIIVENCFICMEFQLYYVCIAVEMFPRKYILFKDIHIIVNVIVCQLIISLVSKE